MYFNYKGQRIFAFSDTHGMHRNWRIPSDTDILICAGDAISNFSEEDLKDFLSWYSKIPARLRIFVPGNHEILFDYYPEKLKSLFPDNIVCLYDNGMEYEGISFYSISCKTLRSNLYSDTQSPVPAYTDILITHFPPKSILDEDDGNEKLKDWMEKSRPAYHLFGHIHSQGGKNLDLLSTHCFNVSCFMKLKDEKNSSFGVVTFKYLLEQYEFEEILQPFLKLWRYNAPELAKRLDLNKWKKIYQSIQAIQEEPSDYYIKLVCRWESCTPMIDMNCSVYSKADNLRDCPMANYHSWAEILGMDILIDEDVEITPLELTAGLLWEITNYGGTEEMSHENQKRIFNLKE